MSLSIIIKTERFKLKELSLEDVTERYLGWLTDTSANRFITSAMKTSKLGDLKNYVSERINRDDVLFLGIFESISDIHIGNIKFEPLKSESGYAIMGILIGEPAWRNKGVAAEVIKESGQWLKKYRNINQIILGVSRDNLAAVKAYEKAGFFIEKTPYIKSTESDVVTMVCHLV